MNCFYIGIAVDCNGDSLEFLILACHIIRLVIISGLVHSKFLLLNSTVFNMVGLQLVGNFNENLWWDHTQPRTHKKL